MDFTYSLTGCAPRAPPRVQAIWNGDGGGDGGGGVHLPSVMDDSALRAAPGVPSPVYDVLIRPWNGTALLIFLAR